MSLAFKAHPHMLRRACGYALANKGHDTRALRAYLGHKNIQHTVRYTELSKFLARLRAHRLYILANEQTLFVRQGRWLITRKSFL